MKNIIIVESSTKARTLRKYLKDKYLVFSSLGHIKDLPEDELGIEIKKDATGDYLFFPSYKLLPQTKRLLTELKKAVEEAKAATIYLATDPDREGEAISAHLEEELKENIPKETLKEIYRALFYEFTYEGIIKALRDPTKIDVNKVEAQKARRILDRLVGYLISPVLAETMKKRGLSAGRVQSVALRLICIREKEIENFVPEEYWTLRIKLKAKEQEFWASLTGKELKKETDAEEIKKKLIDKKFLVKKLERKELKRYPPPPFITSTLQQLATTQLGFSPTKTMFIAQQLYEGVECGKEGPVGLITYMRTDSLRTNPEAISKLRTYISSTFGKEYLSEVIYTYEEKEPTLAQGAHEAIRPTDIQRTPQSIQKYLLEDQYKLYSLIWKRFVASQMAPALYSITKADIICKVTKPEDEYHFKAQGKELLQEGFYIVSPPLEKEEDIILPQLKEGDELTLLDVEIKQHFTQPPPRYTDASLIKVLEKKGIGRPSTYAPTLKLIEERKYVEKKKSTFYPTHLGKLVNEVLEETFPEIVDINFTANLEDKLDKVEEGKENYQTLLDKFYTSLLGLLERAESKIKEALRKKQKILEDKCPLCGKNLVLRTSAYGEFISCSGFPKCRYSPNKKDKIRLQKRQSNQKIKSIKSVKKGILCPKCKIKLVIRSGRWGKFYACQNYPKCSYTQKFITS